MSAKVVSVRIDEKLKQTAQKLAKQYGITLNTVINIKLREFVKEKRLVIWENDTDISYYDNNTSVDFEWTSADDVLLFLSKSLKKDETTAKVCK